MKLPESHEGLPSDLTPGDVIVIQSADPEKGLPRIQVHMVPGGIDLCAYAEGDTTAEDILTTVIFVSTLTWEKLATMYGQRHKQFKIPASLALVEKMLQQRESAVIPMYLRRTMYQTLDLAHLLRILNTRSERQHESVRAFIDEFLTEEMMPHIVELLQTHSAEHAFDHFQITLGGIDHHFELSVFAEYAWSLYMLFTKKDPWRLKCCIECETYYFDATRSGKQQHCTPRCKSRHTSRTYYARRRATQASLLS